MRKKYKSILTFISLLLGICLLIGILYLFYEKVVNKNTEVVVEGELSINYIDGALISENSTYDFSVTNNGTNDLYYEIIIDNLTSYENKIRYDLKSPEASLNISNNSLDVETNILASSILIHTGETQNFTLKVSNMNITSFNLAIKKMADSKEYFYATILKNNMIQERPSTVVGKDLATTDEGLIMSYDDYGQTYYYRGNVLNNYVLLNDNLWRIVRINGDGTVKLILNDKSTELSSYNSEITGHDNFDETSLYRALESYYNTYLQEFDNYIANYKYCKDNINTQNNTDITYNAYERLVTNNIPFFNCLGDTKTSKIGLLSADEVIYAGATFNADNKEYYLYNQDFDNAWWTSTLAKASDKNFYPFAVNSDGKVIYNVDGTLNRFIRPVIVLDRKTTVTGDGTLDNPYIINTE